MKRIILGISGEIASGKGTVAKYLVEKKGGNSHRFSTMLRDVARRMYLEESRENMQKISTLFRDNFGEDLLSAVIAKDVENDKHEIIIIDGVRRLGDIEYLKKLSGFKLIYIETDLLIRYERLTSRNENVDDGAKTLEEFKKDNEREAERQIKDLKEKADFVINNDGSFEELYHQVEDILEN